MLGGAGRQATVLEMQVCVCVGGGHRVLCDSRLPLSIPGSLRND